MSILLFFQTERRSVNSNRMVEVAVAKSVRIPQNISLVLQSAHWLSDTEYCPSLNSPNADIQVQEHFFSILNEMIVFLHPAIPYDYSCLFVFCENFS